MDGRRCLAKPPPIDINGADAEAEDGGATKPELFGSCCWCDATELVEGAAKPGRATIDDWFGAPINRLLLAAVAEKSC